MDTDASDLAGRVQSLETANRSLADLNAILLRQNESLGDLQRSYEQLFDNAADGLVKTDAAGRILLANHQAQVLCGASLDELRERNVASLLPPVERAAFLRGLLAVATRHEPSFRCETELRPPTGQRVTAEFRVTPLMLGGADPTLEIHIENVTQRRREEDLLRKLEERAIVAGMSRHLSHVLLNSLTSAGGFVAAIARETGLSPRGSDAVGIVLQEIRRMEEVVRGYQDYVETTKAHPAEAGDLRELLRAAIAAAPAPAGDEPALTVGELPGEPAPVVADRRIFLLGMGYLFRGIRRAHRGAAAPGLELRARREGDELALEILVPGARVAGEIIETMERPWRHQVLHQTFDSWDLAIAKTMFERHGGQFSVAAQAAGVAYRARVPLLP
jgi:PAS domain S-box-containing protein